ncbi:Y-family DNA polymerase [Microbulbifer sp. DLAB2-AF]|uniref:Y-family DNA polymerase n=1 Tax=Microbulbifer sp. DLAB2-AF TaxID=3243395 RepID=UPI004039637B
MLWLCIRFPKLPLEALTCAQTPEERSQPLAIVEKQIIVEANKAAFEFGVIAGLSITRARQLCPGLQILHRNRERELQLEELAQQVLSSSAMICIKTEKYEEGYRHPQLYLELGNRFKIHGGFRALLHKIQQELAQMDIRHRMGLSHSPSAALLLSQLPEHRRWLQQTHTPPTTQQWKQWISHAPSKLLECDNKTLEKLYSSGFKHVGQLLSAPLSKLGKYFDRSFLDYLARLNGSQQEQATCYSLSPRFAAELFFPRPISHNEQLLYTCNLLLREQSQQRQCHQLHPQRLHWQLQSNGKPISHFNTEALFSQTEIQELTKETKLQLEGISFKKPIHLLRLPSSQLTSQNFEKLRSNPRENKLLNKKRESQKLIDKLKERLGYQAVSGIFIK